MAKIVLKIIMQKALVTMLIVFIIFGIVASLGYALDQSEIASCYKLQTQASAYQGFYITEIEHDMCVSHEIPVDAPVK